MSEKLYTTNEAAELLGVTPARVRQMVLRGEIDAVRMGRDNFVAPDALERAKRRKTQRGPTKGTVRSKAKPEAATA